MNVSSIFSEIFFSLLFIHLHFFSPWDLQADHTVAFGAFFFLCLAPPISPKEIASQHLAVAQTPSAPVDFQADQHLAQVACCRGDNEGCEGEFEGSFGRSSFPCMPALQVEWAKYPLTGASIHLVGDLPLGGAYSNTVNKFYFGLSKRAKHDAIILHVR